MLISVVICTYNRCGSLKVTLDSILNQDINTDFDYEVIVVNNNSKDKTKEVIESYMSKFGNKLKNCFEVNQGRSFAQNRGIAESGGEIIAFTDDDVIVDRNWICTIANIFKNNRTVECVTGKVLPIWKSEKPKWYSDKIKSVIVHVDHGENEKEVNYCVGANSIFLRSVFKKWGGFDWPYRFEDVAFIKKIRECVKINYFPSLIIYHPVQKERLNKKYFKKWFTDAGNASSEFDYFSNSRKFLNVELWRYREVLGNIFNYIANIFDQKERFASYLVLLFFIALFKKRNLSFIRIK